MTAASSNKKITSLQKSLIILFVVYWFIFFPLMWFVIEPPAYTQNISALTIHALFYFVFYIGLHCLTYCCFKADISTLDAVKYADNNSAANGPRTQNYQEMANECQERLNLLKGNTRNVICNDNVKKADIKVANDFVISEGYWLDS